MRRIQMIFIVIGIWCVGRAECSPIIPCESNVTDAEQNAVWYLGSLRETLVDAIAKIDEYLSKMWTKAFGDSGVPIPQTGDLISEVDPSAKTMEEIESLAVANALVRVPGDRILEFFALNHDGDVNGTDLGYNQSYNSTSDSETVANYKKFFQDLIHKYISGVFNSNSHPKKETGDNSNLNMGEELVIEAIGHNFTLNDTQISIRDDLLQESSSLFNSSAPLNLTETSTTSFDSDSGTGTTEEYFVYIDYDEETDASAKENSTMETKSEIDEDDESKETRHPALNFEHFGHEEETTPTIILTTNEKLQKEGDTVQ